MTEHVHGETTVTLDSGRVLCNCGYERLVYLNDDGEPCVAWGASGSNPHDPDDREVELVRRMIRDEEFVA